MTTAIFNRAILVIFLSLMLFAPVHSNPTLASDLLKETKMKGGICLLIGSESLDLAIEIAKSSEFYVQVLQADGAKALDWSKQIADAPIRSKVGVRHALFDSKNYGSHLFNMIVVENQKSLNGISIDELARILIPRGFIFAKEKMVNNDTIEVLNLESLAKHSFVFQAKKKVPPVIWKPANSLKWRAGARAHINIGFMGTVHGSGKFIYRQKMESKDTFPNVKFRIFARDEFNGRTIWTIEEPVGLSFKNWGITQSSTPGASMAIDNRNQFFYITHDNKLLCLNAETGDLKFELMSSGAKGQNLNIYDDEFLICSNNVFSTTTGKRVFSFKGMYTVTEQKVYTIDNNKFKVFEISTGKVLSENELQWLDQEFLKKSFLTNLAGEVLLIKNQKWERPFTLVSIAKNNGEKKWQVDLQGLFAKPSRGEAGQTFGSVPKYSEYNGKILAHTVISKYQGDHQEGYFTTINPKTGEIEEQDAGYNGKLFGNSCGSTVTILGDFFYYWHNVWYDIKAKKKIFPYIVHPSCFLVPSIGEGYIYNVPSRKNGLIAGISAIGPEDISFDTIEAEEKVINYTSRSSFKDETKSTDWPMFRNDETRGNSVLESSLGSALKVAWVADVGLGEIDYDISLERRTGLTQATVAYGFAFVADIDSQCIVAIEIGSGKIAWKTSLGSRVDFSPAIYKGLCLVAAKDGWVYCLNAKTGELVYKTLVAPHERFIGGQEKLESLWPTEADVFVQDGVGYMATGFGLNMHGGCYLLAFDVETGKKLWGKKERKDDNTDGFPRPSSLAGIFCGQKETGHVFLGGQILDKETKSFVGRKIITNNILVEDNLDDLLAYGNSLGRNNEDRTNAGLSDSRAKGKTLSFDKDLTLAFRYNPKGESFENTGTIGVNAFKEKGTIFWATEDIQLVVDDMVLSPKFVYVVGHFQRTVGEPELWVLDRESGKVLEKTKLNAMAAFNGMSLAAGKLFIATRNGKLICLENK